MDEELQRLIDRARAAELLRELGGQQAGPAAMAQPATPEQRDSLAAYTHSLQGGTDPLADMLSGQIAPMGEREVVNLQTSMPDAQPGLGFVDTHLRPFNQGLTFGLWDEGAAGLLSMMPGRGSYSEELERERGLIDRAREEAPVAAYSSEIVGGAIPAILASPAMAGAGILRQMGTMGALGAAEGALHGFGSGEGGFANRARNALGGAAIGGVLGAAAPAAISGVQALARPVTGAIRSAFGVGSDQRAANALGRAMSRAGMDESAVARALMGASADGQSGYTVADALGNPGQRSLSGVARSPGEGRTLAQDFLMDRQLGQADRMGGYLNEALGLTDDTAAQVRASGAARRSSNAGTNYPASDAAAGPVDLTNVLDFIDQRVAPADEGGLRMTPIGQALQRYRSMLEVPQSRLPPGATNAWLSDYRSVLDVKQSLQDDISAAVRAGRGQEAATLIPLRQALDAALEDASPLYRQANDTYRAQSRVLDALDLGQETARAPMRTDDAIARIPAAQTGGSSVAIRDGQPMPSERQAFRVGYGDQMLTTMDNRTPTTNATLPFRTPRQQGMMGEMAEDPDLWRRRLDREIRMAETRGAATGGSMTADNLADQADVAGNVGAVANALSGRPIAALQQVYGRMANVAAGMDEGTREILARALLSRDPTTEISRLLRMQEAGSSQRRAVEAFLRNSGYQALLDQ